MRLLIPLKGSGLKTRLLNPHDVYWDARLGIHTFGHLDSGISDGRYYGAASYRSLRRVFDAIELKPDDVIVDIGCGFGRPLFFAVDQYKVRQAYGIEANANFAQTMRSNITKFRGNKEVITVVETYAQEYDYRHATVIYLYNPFGAETMIEVLEKIYQSLTRYPRPLIIAYLNPIERACFDNCQWLEETECFYQHQLPTLQVGGSLPEGTPVATIYRSKAELG